MTKELTKNDVTDLTVIDGAAGFEEATTSDYTIPFVNIVQKGSPELDDGAKPGQLSIRAFSQILDEMTVVPCYYKKRYVEWTPRDQGGGFRGEHLPESEMVVNAVKNGSKLYTDSGNELIETAYFYCIWVSETGPQYCVFAMTSTALKVARNWMTMAQSLKVERDGKWRQAAMFSHTYNITGTKQTKKDYSWHTFKIGKPEPISDQGLLEAARDFYMLCSQNKVDLESRSNDDESGDDERF